MFDEIRYVFNGMEIDCSRNVGITCLKGYATFTNEIAYIIVRIMDLSILVKIDRKKTNDDGYFNFCVPLNILLGFCEDCSN